MPKRDDIQTILVVGSGPIIIGQAYIRWTNWFKHGNSTP